MTAILIHPVRSAVSIGCLLVALVPYLAGAGISQGIAREADASIRYGADLYVSGEQLGRSVPIPLSSLPVIRQTPGVTAAIPRIVGLVALGVDKEPVVVVGLPGTSLPQGFAWVNGRMYRNGAANELVVGTELARRLQLNPGSVIPPFYNNNKGEHVSTVVGVFRSEVSLWQSRMILTSFETASTIFAQNGTAGDILVYCRPGTAESVRSEIRHRLQSGAETQAVRCKITARADLAASVPAGILHQSGLLHLHFLLAFIAGTLALFVSSGIGLPDRRREIGVLKATGWQTDEILLRGMVESSVISVAAASASVLIAYIWLRPLNGLGIAALVLPGVDWRASFLIPCQLTPLPALLGLLFAWLMVSIGTLSASWRAAIVSPRKALR